VAIRKLSDLSLITYFSVRDGEPSVVNLNICFCELEDGSIVTGSEADGLRRWTQTGDLVQTIDINKRVLNIRGVIELKRDLIVSASSGKRSNIHIWSISTGERMNELTTPGDGV